MRKQSAIVGKSSRTPMKHWIYRYTLGKMVATAPSPKTPCGSNVLVLDMCAGDGFETEGDPLSSSPAIAERHTTSVFPGSEKLIRTAFLYERETTTFARLFSRYGGRPNLKLFNQDSRGITLNDIGAKPGDAVFVYADPNSVSTLPVTPELIRSFTPTTLFLVTLGCNVAGIKRLPPESRKWRGLVDIILTEGEKRRHDILLISLNRDDSQWAYLASFPVKWAEKFKADAVKKGTALWKNGVSAFSYEHEKEQFNGKLDELFYTSKELNDLNQLEFEDQ